MTCMHTLGSARGSLTDSNRACCAIAAFADARHYIADPSHVSVPVQELLSAETAQQRAAAYRPEHRAQHLAPTELKGNPDTVYFCVVDRTYNLQGRWMPDPSLCLSAMVSMH